MKAGAPVPLQNFFQEMGRFFVILWRVLLWTPPPAVRSARAVPPDGARWASTRIPVVLLTALFTGAVMALQTFTTS